MKSALIVGFASAAAVVVLAPPAAAAAAAKPESACQRLRGGQDLAPARKVRLVKRRTAGESALVGCVLPRGKVRVVATRITSDTTTQTYAVLSVAGAYVATSTSYGSQYASSTDAAVTSLRTGRDYRLAGASCRIDQTVCPPLVSVRPAFVTKDGRAAAAISSGGITTIAAFGATGARTELDAGPSTGVIASSLKLTRRTLSWTGTGGARTAPLPPRR
jgi:hypothetical protein